MIGWIVLSRQAVASAEQALRNDQLGVRDEIGFLALHQAFADRLFPGTSVLHTRLRYALFVPWLMQQSGGDPERMRRNLLTLTAQLIEGSGLATTAEARGVIGGNIWRRERRLPSQTPDMMYWSALANWGILQPRQAHVALSRTQVMQRLSAIQRGLAQQIVIDGEPAGSLEASPFIVLPSPPEELLKAGKPLDFVLPAVERAFLRRQLIGVNRLPGKQSLLGRLAEEGTPVATIPVPWHKVVRKVAEADDRHVLTLAERASALAGVGRAVYGALVEQSKNRDTHENSTTYLDHLSSMRAVHETNALALDLDSLQEAASGLPHSLLHVLEETQSWLKSGRPDFSALDEPYRRAEVARKGPRARLGPTLGALRRRAEWNTPNAPHPLAEPLHYRWSNVRQLLTDLGTP